MIFVVFVGKDWKWVVFFCFLVAICWGGFFMFFWFYSFFVFFYCFVAVFPRCGCFNFKHVVTETLASSDALYVLQCLSPLVTSGHKH